MALDPPRWERYDEGVHVETTRGAGAAGPWLYAEARPPALARWVDRLWMYRGPTANRRKRVFPNGRVELLLSFGERYRTVGAAGPSPHAWIAGPTDAPMVVLQPATQDVVGVRLGPEGARRLAGVPLGEIASTEVALDALLGSSSVETLRDRLFGEGPVGRLEGLARWVRDRIAPDPPGEVAWMVGELRASAGRRSIDALRHEAGWSKRRMLAAFRDRVGLTPKRYARIARFHHALGVLQAAPPSTSLAGVAIDAGYYDQPHMNADFRALGGLTPTAFLRLRHPVGDGTTASDPDEG